MFLICRTADQLIEAAGFAQKEGLSTTVLGWGSNVLPSDAGISGLVLLNLSNRISVAKTGEVVADTGASFRSFF